MINLGTDVFECEALFLQPTWTCAKNCDGCYVKEKESKFSSQEIDYDLWWDIFNTKDIYSNQITLALDTLPGNGNSDTYDKMYSIAATYKTLVRHNLAVAGNIKYHLTVNSVHDLEQYTNSELFEGLDLISVSNINSLEDIKRIRQCAPHTKINWNVLASTFKKIKLGTAEEILRHVNQCYLLLPKAPLGNEGHDWQSWETVRKVIQEHQLYERLNSDSDACPVPIWNKIIFDRCVYDSLNYKQTSTGCSSNVSRFQIWPDGRVTGCAYNSHIQYGKFANTIQDILDNLRDARNRYEFNHCTIPNFGLAKIKIL